MYLLADSPRKTISPGATDIISSMAKIEELSFNHYFFWKHPFITCQIIADNPLNGHKRPHSSHATPHTCSNRMKPLHAAFSPDRRQFYSMPDPWKFIPKFLDNSLMNMLILCEHRGGYWSYKFSRMILIKTSQCQEFRLQVKLVRMSFCCYGNC